MPDKIAKFLPYGVMLVLLSVAAVYFVLSNMSATFAESGIAKTMMVDLPMGVVAGWMGGLIFLLWMNRLPAIDLSEIAEEDGKFKLTIRNTRPKAWLPHESANNVLDVRAEMHIVSSVIAEDPAHSKPVTLIRGDFPVLLPNHPQTFVTHRKSEDIKKLIDEKSVTWHGRPGHPETGLRFSVTCRDGFSNAPRYIERKWPNAAAAQTPSHARERS